jgi:hypothetical protein
MGRHNDLIKIKQFEGGKRNPEYYYVLSYVGHLGQAMKKYLREKAKLQRYDEIFKKREKLSSRFIRRRQRTMERVEKYYNQIFKIVGKMAEKVFNYINWNVLKKDYLSKLEHKGYTVVEAKSHKFVVFKTQAEFIRFVLQENIYDAFFRLVLVSTSGFMSGTKHTNYYTFFQWSYLEGVWDRQSYFEMLLKIASKYKVLDGISFLEFFVNEMSKYYKIIEQRWHKFIFENPNSRIEDYEIHCDYIDLHKGEGIYYKGRTI